MVQILLWLSTAQVWGLPRLVLPGVEVKYECHPFCHAGKPPAHTASLLKGDPGLPSQPLSSHRIPGSTTQTSQPNTAFQAPERDWGLHAGTVAGSQ